MGLFTRRAAPVDANTNTATGTYPVGHDGVTNNGTHHAGTYPVGHDGVTNNGTHHTTSDTTGTGHREKGLLRHRGARQSGGRHHGTYPDSLNSRPTFGE
jgi:hypothetical protein